MPMRRPELACLRLPDLPVIDDNAIFTDKDNKE